MIKKFFFAGIALFFAVACSNKDMDDNNNSDQLVPVRVRVSDIAIGQSGFDTRASQALADYTGIKAITLAFYAGDTEVLKTTQLRSDGSTYTTFGEFSCSLPIGAYKMVVVARGMSDGDVFVLTSPTEAGYTSERARETFCTTQDVSVTSTAGLDLSVTLNRVIAKLVVVSTDAISAGVAQMKTTYAAGGKSFSPATGLAISNTGFAVTTSAGTTDGTHLNISTYTFLATDEQTMDITIQALDGSSNVLFTKVVEDVPLKRNRVTTLSGAIFTAPTSDAAFQVETSWLDGNSVDF
ncbi:MAG: hypothetical protein J6W52_05595 [Bacteroidaceae bacterium]|nr:hypothetical protein [Bacteroidaceae bacterium]